MYMPVDTVNFKRAIREEEEVTDFFDFEKYYPTNRTERKLYCGSLIVCRGEKKKLQLRAEFNGHMIEWTWSYPSLLQELFIAK
uniref:DUF4258 domain-containing protein n=1 Tax=Steinernema glaseri TaxID=37863 RepID=A0A1I7ZEZ2_9BILA